MAGPSGTERVTPRAGLALLGTLVYVSVKDPHDHSTFMPLCPIKLATGWDCPSCGGLRMAHDVMHRRFRMAMVDNPFLVLISPVLLFLFYKHSRRRSEIPSRVAYGLLVTALVWGVMRNLPSWPWKPTIQMP